MGKIMAGMGVMTVAALGFGAAMYLDGCNESGRRADVDVQEKELLYVAPEWATTFGSYVVAADVELDLTYGFQQCAPIAGCFGPHKTDEYGAQGHSINSWMVETAVNIRTTREDNDHDGMPDGAPLPEDEVTVLVHPDTLELNSSFQTEQEDRVLTVEDGLVVEEDGRPVEEPWAIAHADGEVTLPRLQTRGGDSNIIALTEAITLNFGDLGDNADEESVTALSLVTSDPAGDQAARDVFSGGLTELVETSADLHFGEQGFDPENVNVSVSGEWPDPEDVPDETGKTYAQRVSDYEDHLRDAINEGDGQAIEFNNDLEVISRGNDSEVLRSQITTRD